MGAWPGGSGEMAARIRDHNWTATYLGPIGTWADRLKLMVEQVLDSPLVSSLVCGPERVLIYNDAAARLYGDRHPDALGRPVPEAFVDNWPVVASFYERVFAGESVQVVAQHLDVGGRGDRDATIFDAYLTPVRGPDGGVAYAHMIGFEVGGSLRAAAKLRDSEERYQALFAASPVPFMVLAPNPPDFTITAANDAFMAATLTTREGLIGHRLFDVFTDDPTRPGTHGSETLAVSLSRVLTSRRPDAMPRTRYDIVTPEGGFEPHWWLAINAPMLDATGEVTAIIHQANRVTELHLAEEAERESRERQAFLLKLSDALSDIADPVQVQRTAMRMLGEHLVVERAFYYHAQHNDDRWDHLLEAEYSRAPESATILGRYPQSASGRTLLMGLARDETVVVTDVRTGPRTHSRRRAGLPEHNHRSRYHGARAEGWQPCRWSLRHGHPPSTMDRQRDRARARRCTPHLGRA